jgi:nucleoid DNA-binding protein
MNVINCIHLFYFNFQLWINISRQEFIKSGSEYFKVLLYLCKVELIFENIEKLLAANDHAIVPGLGGFVIRHQPAQVVNHKMLPPHIAISFNPLMNHHDGLLALEISRSKGITYRKATEIIHHEIRDYKNKLRIGEKLEFGRMGTFTVDDNHKLIFDPSFCPPFIPFNLGLQKISIPKQETHGSKEIVIRIARNQIMKYVAVLLAVVSLLLPPKINESTEVVQADFSRLLLVNLPEILVKPAFDFEQQADIGNPNSETINTNYKVIVAAFYTKEKAEKVCHDLIKRNFPEAEIVPSSDRIAVSVRSFSDFRAAVSFMKNLRTQSDEFADAWVMRNTSSSKN